jgi:hypothetical protein
LDLAGLSQRGSRVPEAIGEALTENESIVILLVLGR